MVTTAAIAEIGALLGDPARVSIVCALLGGQALSAGELAEHAGVSAQTASAHLAKLVAAGLVVAEPSGRHRYHRLASSRVAELLELMHVLGERPGLTSGLRVGPKDAAMREARTCFDHMAGRVAVAWAVALTAAGAVEDAAKFDLSPEGAARLASWGLDLPRLRGGRRVFCQACLDWSERRPHVAGALGAAMLQRALELDWVRRRRDGRALTLTGAGERGLLGAFGVR